MDARGKFGEHELCVRVARGDKCASKGYWRRYNYFRNGMRNVYKELIPAQRSEGKKTIHINLVSASFLKRLQKNDKIIELEET